MPSPSVSAARGDTTPVPRKSKPATKKSTAQRRVYGKRRGDAPRAVLDQKSPAKELDRTQDPVSQDGVDGIQAKLADVRLEESPAPPKEEEPVIEATTTHEPALSPEETPKVPTPNASSPSNQSPNIPRYETMVEVRISPQRIPDPTPVPPNEAPQPPPSSDKRATRKKRCAPRVSSGFIADEKANAYVRSILNEALSPVAAESVQKFSSWAARGGDMLQVVKIAEGSYGEVYKLRLREEVCQKAMSKSKLARLKAYGDGVFKIVPLRARSGPGSKKFTSVDEIVSEVRMLKYLDPIPGFARFREIHVVQGRFPESFQSAWDHYRDTKDDCLNPNPSSKRAYPDTQLWAILEMDDAGCELEKFAWSSTFQIYDIFWGVAMSLARAEEYAQFEHRDLHLGNVCIRSTRPDGLMHPPSGQEIMSKSSASGFGLSTFETTLIDYSLSRAELRSVSEEGEIVDVASSDLDKKQIFDAVGRDEDEILLRNTYRYMRATLYTGVPSDTQKPPDIPGIWHEYAPRTNLVWLLFLLKSLRKNKKNDISLPPPRPALAPCSPNKAMKASGKSDKKEQKPSVGPVTGEMQDHVSRLITTLEGRLDAVMGLLDLEHGHEDMCCAADLVAYAIDSQWLEEQDFF